MYLSAWGNLRRRVVMSGPWSHQASDSKRISNVP